MRKKLNYELVNRDWICEISEFNVRKNPENFECDIELKINENNKIRVLKFLNVSLIEFDSRYSHHGNDLEIVNCADDGMEYVNLKVSGFINGSGNFNFFANELVETFE